MIYPGEGKKGQPKAGDYVLAMPRESGAPRGCEVLELSGAQASIRNPKTGKVNILYRQALRWRP